jgi:hypothetical protein
VVAPPWSTLPWPVLALMEQAVERGRAAFSVEEARRRGVAWLDLVRSAELGGKLAALVAELERDGYRPQVLERLRHRGRGAQALGGAARLPQGARPFPRDQRALQAQELVAGQRDAGGVPRPHLSVGRRLLRRLRHPATRLRHGHALGGRPLVLSGDIEILDKFQRSYRLVRTPLKSVPAEVLRRAVPECRYIVTDENDRIVLSEVAPLGAEANFHIDVKNRLPPGRYTLAAVIAVNGNVMNAEIKHIAVVGGAQ